MTHSTKERPVGQGLPHADVESAATELSWLRRLMMSPSLALSIVIVAFVLFGLTQTDQFANPQAWVNIVRVAVFIAIAASFATIVLVSGGLDLSVGSVLVAGAMTAAALAEAGLPPIIAFTGGTLLGAGVGLLNGLLITYLSIPAIVVTLGSLFAVRSAVVAATQGNPIGPLPDDFQAIGQDSVLGIPVPILIAVVVVFIAHVLLSQTSYGWSVRAMGGNRDAARNAGINVRRVSISVYVLSGASAAFTGALLAARLGSGSPTLGEGFELQVIAAAIIGGTSIAGSIGTVPGALLGALLLSVLSNGLVLLKVDPTWQDFITGVVLVAAAGLDVFRRRQMFRMSAKRASRADRTA